MATRKVFGMLNSLIIKPRSLTTIIQGDYIAEDKIQGDKIEGDQYNIDRIGNLNIGTVIIHGDQNGEIPNL